MITREELLARVEADPQVRSAALRLEEAEAALAQALPAHKAAAEARLKQARSAWEQHRVAAAARLLASL